ncbi:aldose epimerase family protein [Pseudonocardia sp. TRM90224]|uniref:aldose epimerase family protein n=1 Tax=Pseudonocardia sp. TRM90224 TaxID=2812678 RepID=UPI001E65BE40|nr:aldose epimerase family protein [Pseudonocardia sp. TRM90224]
MIGIRSSGLELGVEPRGARIARLRAPDRAGWWDEVAIGLADYADDRNFVGAIVGRYANRIGGGRFTLDGREHVLPRNEPGATLHGGPGAFDCAIWQAEDVQPGVDGGAVTLRHVSPDGENGFPGTLQAAVTYTVRGPDLLVELEATTDAPTVVNLTQHAYFALHGGAGSVEDHEITVHADSYLPIDADLVPEGGPAPVEGTPFDLRRPVRLGERLRDPHPQLQRARGYDHTFVLGGRGPREDDLPIAAHVREPASGRTLTLFTDQPGLQVYSGNMLDGSVLRHDGRPVRQGDALCLEPQQFPDAPNRPDFPSPVLRRGEVWRSRTLLRFGTDRGA